MKGRKKHKNLFLLTECMMLKVKIKIILFFALILILAFSFGVKSMDSSGNSADNKTITGKLTTEKDIGDRAVKVQVDKIIDSTFVDVENKIIIASKTDIDVEYTTISETDLPKLYSIFENSLFIGDSRTEGMKIYSGIQNADFFCEKSLDIKRILSGEVVDINGNEMNISDVLNNKKYDKVFISLGLNELGWKNMDDFLKSYQKLINQIKEYQPESGIYIELIFPVNEEMTVKLNREYLTNERIHEYNIKIAALCKKNKLNCLNPEKAVTDENGSLKSDATNDGIHVNSTYCKQLAGYLAQITNEI